MQTIPCHDCGVDLAWGGKGRPPERCEPCKRLKRAEADAERYRFGSTSTLLDGVTLACQVCGEPIGPYKGKGRIPQHCDSCKRESRRAVNRETQRRRRALTQAA